MLVSDGRSIVAVTSQTPRPVPTKLGLALHLLHLPRRLEPGVGVTWIVVHRILGGGLAVGTADRVQAGVRAARSRKGRPGGGDLPTLPPLAVLLPPRPAAARRPSSLAPGERTEERGRDEGE